MKLTKNKIVNSNIAGKDIIIINDNVEILKLLNEILNKLEKLSNTNKRKK